MGVGGGVTGMLGSGGTWIGPVRLTENDGRIERVEGAPVHQRRRPTGMD
jgi:hypothetical protein